METNFAEEYGDLEQWHWWFRGRRRIIETLLKRELRGAGSRRILSVGCGPVDGLRWLVPFAGPRGHVLGLDSEPLHAGPGSGQVEFVVGRLENAPMSDAQFDAVLALDVLEHLDDDFAGLQEALRLLKPGGLLLLTVPALPSLWGGQDIVGQHRQRYTKRSLSRLLNQAPLSNYQLKYFNTFLFPLVASVRWGRRALGMIEAERSDFEDSRPGLVNDVLAGLFGAERHFINRGVLPIGVSLAATCRAPMGNASK